MRHASASIPKRKNFPLRPGSALLDRWLQSCLAILLINWVFQGVRGMQRKELSFRIGLCLVVAGPVTAAASLASVHLIPAVLVGALIGHSVNFLFNGQFWVCARYCRSYRGSAARVAAVSDELAVRLARLPWLAEVAFIGSRARGGAPSDRSDIDLRMVFPPGPRGWWRTNLLLLRLRTWALCTGLPLDLYAYDDPSALARFDQDEPLLLAKDAHGRMRRMFPARAIPFGQRAIARR